MYSQRLQEITNTYNVALLCNYICICDIGHHIRQMLALLISPIVASVNYVCELVSYLDHTEIHYTYSGEIPLYGQLCIRKISDGTINISCGEVIYDMPQHQIITIDQSGGMYRIISTHHWGGTIAAYSTADLEKIRDLLCITNCDDFVITKRKIF